MKCKDCGAEFDEIGTSYISEERITRAAHLITDTLMANHIPVVEGLAAMEVIKKNIAQRDGLHVTGIELMPGGSQEIH